jgi:hypothetical protein
MRRQLQLFPVLCCLSFASLPGSNLSSPLSKFSSEWNDPKYLQCNTASSASYMNSKEKEIVYILNLLRTSPRLFASTVVKKYPEYSGNLNLRRTTEFKSLMKTLENMKAVPLVAPDALCYASAQCHAYSSGQRGYVGHERKDKNCKSKKYFNGECCDYGHQDPLDILMSLLVDEKVPSLGHRMICLGPYRIMGVSIQPHRSYGYNAVLDFSY